ncbi:MAG TPA: wax ester/triacylglycerol synthase family O-acyltransferase [Solirubrobacteraceae bacterium]
MVGESLTPLDATFLELEEADESAHMHIGAVLVFDAAPDGIPSLDRLCAQLDERLPALPRYRQRLSTPHTGGLSWPSWVDDARFDVADHVRHAALPAPGGRAELCEWAADFWSHRLDRRVPLWEVALVEGLEDGRWALVTKTHHCLVDGIGSLDAGYLLLDASPDSAPAPPAIVASGDGEHRTPQPLAAALRAARAGADLVAHPGRVREVAERSRAVVDLLVRDEVIAAPRTSLGVPIGPRRRFAAITTELEELKQIKRALGGTINDVVLAAVTGGLRCLLECRDEALPRRGLRAMVPVNVREPGQQLGNHISSLFVDLPVAEPDPARRYAATLHEAESLKSGSQAIGGRTLVELAGLAPPVLHAVLARSLFASRLFNVTITNVPGPQQPLYAFGAPLLEVMPLVPLAAEHAVGVAAISYNGRLTFGVIADHETVRDIDALAAGIRWSLDELAVLAAIAPVAQ